MAKFTGANITATMGSSTWLCITSVETNESADVYTQACAGSSYKARVVGPIDASFTINYLADTTGNEAKDFRPGTTGTFTCSLSTGTYNQFSGAGIIESHSMSAPVEGFVTGTVVIGINGALTVGA